MILLDTNALVALVDPRDEHNAQAEKELARLSASKLLVTWPVLAEAFHFIHRDDLREYLFELLSTFNIKVFEEQHQLQLSDLADWLLRYGDHSPDFADAYLVVIASMHPRWKIWTYDHEFRSIWRRLDGSAVPLANRQ